MSSISKYRFSWIALSLLIIISIVMTGCAPTVTPAPSSSNPTPPANPPAATTGDVRVAFIGPLTGSGSADLILASKGAQLAVDQRNAAGGICGGRKVKMELSDDQADPKGAANVATQLIGDKGILAVLHGWNSSAVLAAAPIFNQAGLVQMDYYGVAPAIHTAGPYTFRVIPTGDLMAKYLAKWVVSDEGLKNVASFYENSDYGNSLYNVFAPEVKKLGGTIVASEATDPTLTDFSAIISKFKAANAQAVIIFGQYESAAYWVKQAPDLGFSAPLFGSDGIFAPDLITLAGKAAEGIRTVSAYTIESTDPYVASFVKAFRAANGTDPNNGAGYTYDAMVLVLNGLDAGNCTRDGVKDYLTNKVQNIQGVTGTITLQERDRLFEEGLYTKLIVKGGKFVGYTK
jgi:branched-chain amino acid transport system substrate-binding protein